jgi:hypothetical protein
VAGIGERRGEELARFCRGDLRERGHLENPATEERIILI